MFFASCLGTQFIRNNYLQFFIATVIFSAEKLFWTCSGLLSIRFWIFFSWMLYSIPTIVSIFPKLFFWKNRVKCEFSLRNPSVCVFFQLVQILLFFLLGQAVPVSIIAQKISLMACSIHLTWRILHVSMWYIKEDSFILHA